MDKEEDSRNDLDSNNTDGFKFAVTLIVAFSTIAYKIYDFVKNNPVNDFWYSFLTVFIPISFTVIGLIAYLIIKGISFEIDDNHVKEKLKNMSSLIYVSTFLLIFWYLCVRITSEIFSFLFEKANFYSKDGIIIYVSIILSIFILIYSVSEIIKVRNLLGKDLFWKNFFNWSKIKELVYSNLAKEKSNKFSIINYQSSLIVIYLYILFIISILLFAFTGDKIKIEILFNFSHIIVFIAIIRIFLFVYIYVLKDIFISIYSKIPHADIIYSYLYIIFSLIIVVGYIFTPYLLAGNIVVKMDENYFVKNNQIPVDIVNTGHNGNITVNLSKKNVEENITMLDTIGVSPAESTYPVTSSYYLRITTLDYGKYKVYINTTNLTQGHYEFSVIENPQNNSILPNIVKKSFTSFYLDK